MTQIALRKIARTVWILALAALFCASWQFAQAQDSDDDPVQPPTDTKNYVPKFTSTGGALANSQILDNGTDVGVGTSAPASKLHVSGKGTALNQTAAAIEITNTAPGGTENWWLRAGATGNNTPAGGFSLGNSDAYWMTVTFNGNFGLGYNVNNPKYALEMADGAYENGGTWTNASDRNLKENFSPVDPAVLLTKIDAMSIETWNYRSEGKTIRHLGPVAQDFYAAFDLGRDDKHISTVDEGGVALAAIQQLYRMVVKGDKEVAVLTQANREKDAQIQQLKAEVGQLHSLEQAVQILSTKLSKIESKEAGTNLLRASK